MNVASLFHRWSGYRFKRIFPADELIKLIEEFESNPLFRFHYRCIRVDDALGGLVGTIDRLGALKRARLANYRELRRYHLALHWTIERHPTMGHVADEEVARYKEVVPLFEAARAAAREKIAELQSRDVIFDESDILSKQVKIAFWSAVGSVAAAIAGFLATVVTYMQTLK